MNTVDNKFLISAYQIYIVILAYTFLIMREEAPFIYFLMASSYSMSIFLICFNFLIDIIFLFYLVN